MRRYELGSLASQDWATRIWSFSSMFDNISYYHGPEGAIHMFVRLHIVMFGLRCWNKSYLKFDSLINQLHSSNQNMHICKAKEKTEKSWLLEMTWI